MWNICYSTNDDSVYRLYDTPENPRYYICERLITVNSDNYKKFGEQQFKEIVSVDKKMFYKRTIINYTQASELVIPKNQQILCVMCMLDDNGDINDSKNAEPVIRGFSFCGFDLADNWEISVLINCGKGFQKAFTYKDLNKFGLIPNYQLAKEIQEKLMDNYPEEEHAYCALFAVWRKIGDS